jgi:hypothetical protein
MGFSRISTTSTMVCRSPLRLDCRGIDIRSGYLYRSTGNLVRPQDEQGISCRSSVCTLACTHGSTGDPREISHWKATCKPDDPECNGKDDPGKVFCFTLPIADFDDNADLITFNPRWDRRDCDETHCLIEIRINGNLLAKFINASDGRRTAINMYLKRIARKDK